jgi:predicted amino acid-binding ACT domain protein
LFSREAGGNLLAVHAFPRNRRTQVDVVPEDPTAFKNVAKAHKLKVQGLKICLLVDGEDRPGVLADLTDRLGSARINMTAVTGLAAGQGRFGVILWVKPRDVKKAAKVFSIELS